MIIRGGQVFIMHDDVLPTVTITKAMLIMDLPANSTKDDMTSYLNHRCGPKSVISDCVLRSLDGWAKEETFEGIRKAQSDVHLESAPIGQRIREFFSFARK